MLGPSRTPGSRAWWFWAVVLWLETQGPFCCSMFPNLAQVAVIWEACYNTGSRAPAPRRCDSVALEQSLGICIFSKHLGIYRHCWSIEHSMCYPAHQSFQRKIPADRDIWHSNREVAAVNKCQHLAGPAVSVSLLSMDAPDAEGNDAEGWTTSKSL